MSEECMNPECHRLGTIRLLVFSKHVGMVCQRCSDGLASHAYQPIAHATTKESK